MNEDTKKKIPSLNGLRAISILIVMLSHVGYGKIIPGGFGVTIFFFLSGYLITTLLMEERNTNNKINIKKFYLRRFFRLSPPLYVTVLIAYGLVMLGLLGGEASSAGFFAQILYFYNYYALFFDGYRHVPDGTSILWSLAIEEHFYVLYPLLFSVLLAKFDLKRIGLFFILLCFMILSWRYYLALSPNFNPDRTYYATDTRLDSILFGCILAVMKNPINDELKRNEFNKLDWMLLIASFALILISLVVRGEQFRESLRYTLQGIALMPIFYLVISKSKNIMHSILNLSMLNRLGELSYSIYLIHFIIINVIMLAFVKIKLSPAPLIVFLITLLSAYFYALFIERFIEPKFKLLRKIYH